MSKKDDLQKDVEKIFLILVTAKENFQFYNYLHNPHSPEELAYLTKNQLFRFLKYSTWRLTIIDLAKLFHSNDKCLIIKLLSKLKPDGEYKSIRFDEAIINSLLSKYYDSQSVIKEILRLRDKVYAHADIISGIDLETDISYKDITIVIEFVEFMLTQIGQYALETSIDFDSVIVTEGSMNFVKVLSADKKRQLDEIFKKR